MIEPQTAPEENADYHSDTEWVSASMLKSLRLSPRIFEGRYITRTIPSKETPGMRTGTAVHCYTTEFDQYAKRYTVAPHKDRRTKAYREWATTVGDREILTEAEHAVIESCRNALLSVPVIATLIESDGPVEQSIRHTDSETGVPCKIRCDKLVFGSSAFVVDIKTVSEWSPRKFAYACDDFGYHIQAAHYASIASQHYEIDLPEVNVLFAVVETQPPFRARACVLDDRSMQLGFQERYSLLCEYQDRMESGDWSEVNEHELTSVTLPSVYRKGQSDGE